MTWSPAEIETARAAHLAPILARKGYALARLPNGAVLVRSFRGLIVHGSRWSWKCENLYGNTIDFFITVEGNTFNEAMEIVTASKDDPTPRKRTQKPPAHARDDDDEQDTLL
jgi:hypothetical protein